MSEAGAGSGGGRWRYYRSPEGHDPVRAFLHQLAPGDRIAVVAQMKRLREGERAGGPVRGGLAEIRASREGRAHRVVFAREGRRGQILLALDGFTKTTARTPALVIERAEGRLRDWRERGRVRAPAPVVRGRSPVTPTRSPVARARSPIGREPIGREPIGRER